MSAEHVMANFLPLASKTLPSCSGQIVISDGDEELEGLGVFGAEVVDGLSLVEDEVTATGDDFVVHCDELGC